MTYSIIGILAAIILVITNRDVLWKAEGAALTSTQKSYRSFLYGVMAYYITEELRARNEIDYSGLLDRIDEELQKYRALL